MSAAAERVARPVMMAAKLWHGPRPGRLIVEPLDSLTTVFDCRSGQTHVLAPPLPELIDALADRPATIADLALRLSELFDLTADGDVIDMLAARLGELSALGLVEAR